MLFFVVNGKTNGVIEEVCLGKQVLVVEVPTSHGGHSLHHEDFN